MKNRVNCTNCGHYCIYTGNKELHKIGKGNYRVTTKGLFDIFIYKCKKCKNKRLLNMNPFRGQYEFYSQYSQPPIPVPGESSPLRPCQKAHPLVFDMTNDGYERAKKYLEDSGQLWLLEKELSTDGYTLVALANSLIRNEGK